MFAAVRVVHDAGVEQGAQLAALVEKMSPRVEWHGAGVAVLDTRGLGRVWGDAESLSQTIGREAASAGLHVAVAVAPTRVAALLLVYGTARHRVVYRDTYRQALAVLPLTRLETLVEVCGASGGAPVGAARAVSSRRSARIAGPRVREHHRQSARHSHGPPLCALDPAQARELVLTLRRWGLETLGDFTALPADQVRVRLGAVGVQLQRLAGGDDDRPLVPAVLAPVFEATVSLEWPVEGLEPLSFVLGRVVEEVCARLERHDRGGVCVHVRLRLVDKSWHERRLELPAPMRDPKVLRTLILLDLERHPPTVGIDAVTVGLDPAPGRIVQHSLLDKAMPAPEQVSTLLARLTALVGEGRCGAPALVDSHRPGRWAMVSFAPAVHTSGVSAGRALVVAVVRRFRPPVAVRVEEVYGRPSRVWASAMNVGGIVRQWAGPWRESGAWWPEACEEGSGSGASSAWDHDEWDVELSDGGVYRLSHARHSGQWWLEGMWD